MGFTLNSVVGSPRTSTPLDVKTACENLSVDPLGEEAPTIVRDAVHFMVTDFFALAHRTGLYNRQRGLWEALARIAKVEVFRLKQGIFQKTELPQLDVHLNDSKNRTLIFMHMVEPQAYDENWHEDERRLKEIVKTVQQRAEKLKGTTGALQGAFLCFPRPFPEIVLNNVQKMTSASDPVGRYESLLPEPLLIPLNLIDVDRKGTVRLVHPHLEPRKTNAVTKAKNDASGPN